MANLNVNINYWHVDGSMTMPSAAPQPVGTKMSSSTGAQGYAAMDPGSLKGSLWQGEAQQSPSNAAESRAEADVAAGPESTGGAATTADAADCGTEAAKAEVDPAFIGTRSFSKGKSPAAPPEPLAKAMPTQSKSKGCVPSVVLPPQSPPSKVHPPPGPPPGWTAKSKAGAPPPQDDAEEHMSEAQSAASPAVSLYQAIAGPLAGWLSTQPTQMRGMDGFGA